MKRENIKKIKKCLVLLFILSMVFSLAACNTANTSYKNFKDKFFPDEKGETIKVGVYEPITGEYSASGALEVKGIEIANMLYPSINGKDIELIYLDNKSDMYEGEEVLNNLVTSEYAGVIGSYGDVLSLVCGKKIKELLIPALTPTSTNSLLTVNNPYYFTTTYTDDNQGAALARYIYSNYSNLDVAIVSTIGDDTVTGVKDNFVSKLSTYEGSSSKEYRVELEQTDYTELIANLKKGGYNLVLLLLPVTSSESFMTQCNLQSYTPSFLGTRVWDTDEMETFLETNYINGTYCTDNVLDSENSMSEEFIKKYKEVYPEEEIASATALAFDSYMILFNAIESTINETGSFTGTTLKDAISATANYEGASGVISYEGSNVATKSISIKHVYKNKPVETVVENVIEEKTSDNSSDKKGD